jgi:hypothetical protein
MQENYMSQDFVQDLTMGLQKDKWHFYYRKDDYAWRQLSYVVQHGHPIAPKPKHTMAWVRIDIAPDLSHALIEEIQTDWLRQARYQNTWRTRRDLRSRVRRTGKDHCNGRGVSEKRGMPKGIGRLSNELDLITQRACARNLTHCKVQHQAACTLPCHAIGCRDLQPVI